MTVLFGHPSGNPNSHHAGLSHLESGWLEAFCVPWMPSPRMVSVLSRLAPSRSDLRRLTKRGFGPLEKAPKVQGRLGEWRRLALRALGRGGEKQAYEANDWLMQIMMRECGRLPVTAIHSYEDCSLKQFMRARELGKACIYDLPTGYFAAWQEVKTGLFKKYSDWLPEGGLPSELYARPDQKRREMELADLVLVPSSFVEETVRSFHPEKRLARASYGVDSEYWSPANPERRREDGPLRFLFAGQVSLQKGVPFLLDAWRMADLRSAHLELAGVWRLAEQKRSELPRGVTVLGHCSPAVLREHYRAADVFVFPSYFEGLPLVMLEAMACGLPVIASDAAAGPELLAEGGGSSFVRGDIDALVAHLRWFDSHRELLANIGAAARAQAQRFTWSRYREAVATAVGPLV